ncbi:MAG: GTPase/DUF3482 domain-containing protein [Pseudomonadota bacterium]
MKRPLLKMAIVGHTNTGKTSLVRTLTRNRRFGEVEDRGGSTRQITATELGQDGQALIELYDSPGLENAPELIEWLDRQPGDRHAGQARIQTLLDDGKARQRFDQEARVLELMLGMDIGLYVIDAREPVLEKYQDELAILSWCARPIVPVLNFTSSADSRPDEWRRALADVTLHTVIAFDVAVRDPASEQRLFEKLKSQLDEFGPTLDAWLARLDVEEEERFDGALRAISTLLIDVAAARRHADRQDPEDLQRQQQALQKAVRRREQATVETLLALHRFGARDYDDDGLPLSDGRWAGDPFDPETLRRHGIEAGKFAGLGAGAGALVDVATGGLSLGAGIVIGTLAGGGAGVIRSLGGRAIDRFRGRVLIAVDDATLALLASRQLHLLGSLRRLGHGSPETVSASQAADQVEQNLPVLIRRARHRPHWSELNPGARIAERQACVDALSERFKTQLESESMD